MFDNLGATKKYLSQAAQMLVGVPDYDTYLSICTSITRISE